MNAPPGQAPESRRASGSVDGDIASRVSQRDPWWLLSKAVLVTTGAATAVVDLTASIPVAAHVAPRPIARAGRGSRRTKCPDGRAFCLARGAKSVDDAVFPRRAARKVRNAAK
jgi:hypothetical protein